MFPRRCEQTCILFAFTLLTGDKLIVIRPLADRRLAQQSARSPAEMPSRSTLLIVISGGMPEWLKGTDCKSVGYAYVGSNPTPSTTVGSELRVRGYSSMVEQQPSKLNTRVRFPLPAPNFSERFGV